MRSEQAVVGSSRERLAVGLVLLAAVATLAFASALPPREAVPAWLGLLALTSALGVAAAALLRGAPPRQIVLLAAVGAASLRLGALAAPVSLSDDVHRYVWDGVLVSRGEDPFAARPRAVVGAHPELDAAALARLNSPDYYSVYPPLAQLAFALGGLAERAGLEGTLALRALFALADLGTVALLFALLAELRRPAWWALLYALSPVVAWEVAGGGHTEALLGPLLVATMLAALRARPRTAGLLLGLAAGAKLTALLAAPILLTFLWRRHGAARAIGATLLAPLVLAALFAPFASAHLVPHVGESLALYAETFSFHAPFYYGARWLLGYREGLTPPVDDVLGPGLGLATLAALSALALRQDGDAGRFVTAVAWAFAAHLLLGRVAHPWYFLPVLALAAVSGRASLYALSTLSVLSYLRYHPLGHESPWVLAAAVLAFAILAMGEAARRPPRPMWEPAAGDTLAGDAVERAEARQRAV